MSTRFNFPLFESRMKNPVFQFKKFEVRHEINGQKVSTDSVLLGAWADFKNSKYIVDIGTGSGVLALMAAQRTNEDTRIYAIEKEKSFFDEAVSNFKNSPFVSKINCFHSNILDWNEVKADHVICNPPYFSQSLLSPDLNRTAARHTDDLSVDDLVKVVNRILVSDGKFSFVSPKNYYEKIKLKLLQERFFETRNCFVRHTEFAEVSIVLAEFSLEESALESTELILKANEVYTDSYRNTVKDFLTIF